MDTDRNLLFGVLALQADFLDAERFAEACSAWAARKEVPLADLLVQRGWLTAEDRGHVEYLLERKLKKHGGDARASLAEAVTPSARRSLAGIADDEVQRSLDPLSEGEIATTAHEPEGRGRYRLLNLYAQGGIGQVWLARDPDLGRDVALKELRPERRDHSAAQARFLEEAWVTGQLEHPGIVPVHELVREAEGRTFYTMRLVRGRTLGEAIKEYHRKRRASEAGPLDLRGLLTGFVSVCQAVAFAHSRKVIHRDLKPANVVQGDYGEVVLLDWGLAKVLGAADEGAAGLLPVSLESGGRDETAQGQVLGTPAYMAPEQAEGRVDQIGPATDVYGLGAVLYEVLAGQPPFAGPTDEVIRRVAREEPARPRQVVAQVPAALEAVCLKALAKRLEERYGSAGELAKEVERWLADEPVSAWREPLQLRARRWVRKHTALASGLAATLMVGLLFASGGAIWRGRELERRRGAIEAELERVEEFQQEGRWAEARAALDQAEARFGDVGPADLRERLQHARVDLDLVARLEAIRLDAARMMGSDQDAETPAQKYAEVFGAAGLGEVGDETAVVARRAAGSKVREALVAGLDHWASVVSDAVPDDMRRIGWVLEVARLADPHPWRDRLRDPVLWRNSDKLAPLVEQAPVSALTPQLAAALGSRLLFRLRTSVEGEALLRSAQKKNPNDFWLNLYLADALMQTGNAREAVGYFRAALALRPESPIVPVGLGSAIMDTITERMRENRRWREKEALLLEAIQLLGDTSRLPASFRISAASASRNLGFALEKQGKGSASLAAYRQALTLDLNTGLPQNTLARVERIAKLEANLTAYVNEQLRPGTNDERLELALVCKSRRLYRASARLYTDAFTADAKRADALQEGHRYNAACSAALAAFGKEDEGKLDDLERRRLRKQALVWLRADLALWSKEKAVADVVRILRDWQIDLELASVREQLELLRIPVDERQDWNGFWGDVESLCARLEAK
jgi:tetratricopeptide (TPR) repeat protein/tRNA A-37 threonylcarbamoyl transferase component Bud32